MFIKLIILSLSVTAIAFAAIGLRILLRSEKTFPEIHVGKNKEMKKLGITCAQKTDTACGTSGKGYPGCSSCKGE
jgi:hypothetical protein